MANDNETFDAFRNDYMSSPGQPRAVTKAEYLELPENAKLKKDIRSSAIICYVCAGLTAVLGMTVLKMGAGVLLDAAILLGLGLGIHLKQSKVCAIVLLVYSLISCVLTTISTGRFSGYLIVIAGVYAVIYTFRLDKQWKEYQQQGL